MTSKPVSTESYLASVHSEARGVLESLRSQIIEAVPEAIECISYAMPAFKYRGKLLACYAAFKSHCSYYPCCSTAFAGMPAQFRRFITSKGTLQFSPGDPLPPDLIRWLLTARMAEIDANLEERRRRSAVQR